MKMRSILAAGLLCVAAGVLLTAQQPPPQQPIPDPFPAQNPHAGNKEAIRNGMALYRSRCSDCHGLDASGYRGPDLTALVGGGASDQQMFATIRRGVQGTEMPSTNMPDDQIFQILAYLRNIGSVQTTDKPTGNVEHGAQLFNAQCNSCHRVAGKGGRLGPDLSRVGIARSRAALIREIRTPNEFIGPGYETVTLVTKDGQKIRGTKKNEDVFSVQIMDTRERIQGYLRSDLQDVVYDTNSLMPAYGAAQLNDNDLNDLVGYLSSLRGTDVSIRAAQ
jgi:putative heme-binding domain-containing protein